MTGQNPAPVTYYPNFGVVDLSNYEVLSDSADPSAVAGLVSSAASK